MASITSFTQDSGALVNVQLVRKEADWTRFVGDEERTDRIQFFVRRVSHAAFTQASVGAIGGSEGLGYTDENGEFVKVEGGNVNSSLIAACIRHGDSGELAFSYVEAYRLEPALAGIFTRAINEVYEPKKSLPPKKTSGVKLSKRASAVTPSKKQKKASSMTKS